MTRYRYNRQVEPPAPYVHVKISHPDGSSPPATIPALLDSGADTTVIPHHLAQELNLLQSGLVEAKGLNDLGSLMATYIVNIAIGDFPPVAVEVFGALGEEYVLLGRDVLNRHRVTLDGPQLLCVIE